MARAHVASKRRPLGRQATIWADPAHRSGCSELGLPSLNEAFWGCHRLPPGKSVAW